MMSPRIDRNFARSLLGVVIALAFVIAGLLKVMDPGRFLVDILAYELIPYHAAAFASVYLPCLEIICGLLLMFDRRSDGAILLMIFMLLVFIGALSSAWFRGLDISCGCFGSFSEAANFPCLIVRNLMIGAVLVILLLIKAEKPKKPSNNC